MNVGEDKIIFSSNVTQLREVEMLQDEEYINAVNDLRKLTIVEEKLQSKISSLKTRLTEHERRIEMYVRNSLHINYTFADHAFVFNNGLLTVLDKHLLSKAVMQIREENPNYIDDEYHMFYPVEIDNINESEQQLYERVLELSGNKITETRVTAAQTETINGLIDDHNDYASELEFAKQHMTQLAEEYEDYVGSINQMLQNDPRHTFNADKHVLMIGYANAIKAWRLFTCEVIKKAETA